MARTRFDGAAVTSDSELGQRRNEPRLVAAWRVIRERRTRPQQDAPTDNHVQRSIQCARSQSSPPPPRLPPRQSPPPPFPRFSRRSDSCSEIGDFATRNRSESPIPARYMPLRSSELPHAGGCGERRRDIDTMTTPADDSRTRLPRRELHMFAERRDLVAQVTHYTAIEPSDASARRRVRKLRLRCRVDEVAASIVSHNMEPARTSPLRRPTGAPGSLPHRAGAMR